MFDLFNNPGQKVDSMTRHLCRGQEGIGRDSETHHVPSSANEVDWRGKAHPETFVFDAALALTAASRSLSAMILARIRVIKNAEIEFVNDLPQGGKGEDAEMNQSVNWDEDVTRSSCDLTIRMSRVRQKDMRDLYR
jgi:hypothetical protein